MGLDMFAYKVPKKDVRGDFKFKRTKKVVELDYWRKHHDLHGWFENLYLFKGGNEIVSDTFEVEANSLKEATGLDSDF